MPVAHFFLVLSNLQVNSERAKATILPLGKVRSWTCTDRREPVIWRRCSCERRAQCMSVENRFLTCCAKSGEDFNYFAEKIRFWFVCLLLCCGFFVKLTGTETGRMDPRIVPRRIHS